MFIQPWDAALDADEWRTWIAEGHDFGLLSVNGEPGRPPAVVPTHFITHADDLLVHLARPNPVWTAIEHDPTSSARPPTAAHPETESRPWPPSASPPPSVTPSPTP